MSNSITRNLLFGLIALFTLPGMAAQAPEAVVHARMYWMKGCPHCEFVIEQVLPPLQQDYGEGLSMDMVELVTIQDVNQFYAMTDALGIPKEKTGVPLIMIGDQVLIGQDEIADRFPALVADFHARGGVPPAPTPAVSGKNAAAAQAGDGMCLPAAPCATDNSMWWWIIGGALALLAAGGLIVLRRKQNKPL